MTTQPPLRATLEDYLRLRRALGFKLNNAGRLLGQFVDYLEERGVETISIDDALAWASLPAGASNYWRAIRLGAVRGFAAYLHGIDASVIVPPAGIIRSGPCRATPYLYSAAEIASLLEATAELSPRLRSVTYYSLIGLLAVSGMRIGEAIALDDDDLDTGRDLLIIRHAKFDKVRLVPLQQSECQSSSLDSPRSARRSRARNPGRVRSTRECRSVADANRTARPFRRPLDRRQRSYRACRSQFGKEP